MRNECVSDINHIRGHLQLINLPPCLRHCCVWLFKFLESHRTERAPVKVAGVDAASWFILHPLVNPRPWTSHSVPFLLLICTCPVTSFCCQSMFLWLYFAVFNYLSYYFLLLPPLMNADDIDFPCNWAALEPRLQITGSTKRLYIPREAKSLQLEMLQRCLATQPC